MVSHELRVPLTSIKGSVATVLNDPSVLHAAEMVLQFFRIINQQADHMSGLINDLLDVARMETGTLLVTPEPMSVAELVDQARNSFLSSGGAAFSPQGKHTCSHPANRLRDMGRLPDRLEAVPGRFEFPRCLSGSVPGSARHPPPSPKSRSSGGARRRSAGPVRGPCWP